MFERNGQKLGSIKVGPSSARAKRAPAEEAVTTDDLKPLVETKTEAPAAPANTEAPAPVKTEEVKQEPAKAAPAKAAPAKAAAPAAEKK